MRNKLIDVRKLVQIQILLTVLFIFFRAIRPSVLKSGSPDFFKKMLLSLPNFFEAVVGILILTAIGLVLNDRLNKKYQIGLNYVYVFAVLIAGIFVITQELKFHNLGGNNVLDYNDVIYSCIGVIFGYWILLYVKPSIHNKPFLNDSKTD